MKKLKSKPSKTVVVPVKGYRLTAVLNPLQSVENRYFLSVVMDFPPAAADIIRILKRVDTELSSEDAVARMKLSDLFEKDGIPTTAGSYKEYVNEEGELLANCILSEELIYRKEGQNGL